MTWVDERERGQAVLANKRTGALAAGTSCWRQYLERLACRPLGKRQQFVRKRYGAGTLQTAQFVQMALQDTTLPTFGRREGC